MHVYVWLCVCVCVHAEHTEAELLHTYSEVDPLDTLILCVRLAVLVAVTLTVPVVLFPVRTQDDSVYYNSNKYEKTKAVKEASKKALKNI